jgi:DNA ligase (NAD+)
MPNNILHQINILLHEINKHDIAYHQQDAPTITDANYDQLKQQLNQYKKQYPQYFDTQKTAIAPPALSIFGKIKHNKPMLSLANAFTEQDVLDFIEKISRFLAINTNELAFWAETKIDGLSFSANYTQGKLQYVATRGDGLEGEDITKNMLMVKNFPSKINNAPNILEVRGEIYMSKSDFLELNQKQEELGGKIFANPRNAAAGSIRQLDANITASRNLQYFIYSVGIYSDDFICQTQQELHQKLHSFGFVIENNSKLCYNIAEIMAHYQYLANNRYNLNYDLDGMVYKVNNLSLQNRLGFIANSPRWAVAHKFLAQQAKTKIINIITQVGRTGAITPVAVLEPINIGGVLVSRASLHNQDEIKRKKIAIGDVVLVQRAGDVIPQIIEVDFSCKSYQEIFILPVNCPSCGSITQKTDTILRCPNSLSCPEQIIESLKHFVSKDAFNIMGLGKKRIQYLVQEKLITSFSDIFLLKNHQQYLQNQPGWEKKSVENLLFAIKQSQTISLEKFIYALGIRHIGQTIAKMLASYFVSFNNFYEFFTQTSQNSETYTNFIALDGIGNKMAVAIFEYFSAQQNKNNILTLASQLDIANYSFQTQHNHQFTGKTIVFTGEMLSTTRAEAKNIAENLGMKVLGAVSSKTHYVVYGNNAGNKLAKAKELNIILLNEEQWLNLTKNL